MPFDLIVPTTPRAAVEALAEAGPAGGAALAGGTDLLLDLEENRVRAGRVVSLRKLPWNSYRWEQSALVVGSTLPLSELESDLRLRQELPALWTAIHAVGSLALRHRATMGGNLGRAAPASDLLPVLLALDAELVLFGREGRRTISIDRFLEGSRRTALRPAELVEEIRCASPQPSEYLWQRVRPANDISQVGVAVAYSSAASDWRVAVGGVSPRPLRVPEAESKLRHLTPLETEVEEASEEAARRAPFVTDKRATEAYRRQLVKVLVARAVRAVAQRAKETGA